MGDRNVHETLRRLSKEFSLPDLLRSALPLGMQGLNVPPPPPELRPMFEGTGSLEETVERLKKRDTARAHAGPRRTFTAAPLLADQNLRLITTLFQLTRPNPPPLLGGPVSPPHTGKGDDRLHAKASPGGGAGDA